MISYSIKLIHLFFAFIQTTSGQLPCPKGWTYVRPSCWKYHPDPASWPEARFECQSLGSELASIHSEEENRLITTLIDKFYLNSEHHSSQRRKQVRSAGDLSCFDKHPSATLVGYAEVVISSTNVNACLMECLTAQSTYNIQCHSVLYYSATLDCILNTQSRLTKPDLFITDTSGILVDYFDNNCNDQITPAPTGNCFKLYAHMVLIGFAEQVVAGVSGQQCQDECISAMSKYGFDCRSVVYYSIEQSCILNRESRQSKPDLFTSDPSADYYERMTTCNINPPPPSCPNSVMDLFFLVDSSNSIGPQGFENIRQFLKNVVGAFNISPNGTFVGLAQFNEEPKTEFHLKSYQTTSEVLSAIDTMKWMGGHTLIEKALKHVSDYELVVSQGDRTPNVPNVVIVLTDGLSQDNPLQAAQLMRSNGVIIYAIGVTEAVLDEQLMVIAGSTERVYKVIDFTRLDTHLRDQILRDICNPPKPMPPVVVNPCNPNSYYSCHTVTSGYPSPVYHGYPNSGYGQPPSYLSGLPPVPLQTFNQPAVNLESPAVSPPSFSQPTVKQPIVVSDPTQNVMPAITTTDKLESLLPVPVRPPSPFAFVVDMNPERNEPSSRKASNTSPESIQPPRGVWIGITDQFSEGQFVWADNTPVNYTNWKFAQPDGDMQENCVLSQYEPLQRWIDTGCSLKYPFFCKKSPRMVQKLK